MGMVKLAPEDQEVLVAAEPAVFVGVKGGWGRQGTTNVRLQAASEATLRSAITEAGPRADPKRLAETLTEQL
jgi:hypothetical protein